MHKFFLIPVKLHKPANRPLKQCIKLDKNRENPASHGSSSKRSQFYEYKLVSVKRGEHPSEKKFLIAQTLEIERDKTVKINTNVEKDIKKNLPEALTEKHIKTRKEVESNLNKKKNDEPIEIEPLYFITGHEEFAFMDMEPFLKAVEYALHGKMVLIEGHTDSMGNDDDNLKFSMRRVSRIKQLMVDIGVNEDLISVTGYGEAEPKYDNNTEEGRQKNRRVDFKVF